MTPINLVLNRLEKVRKRQDGQWSACCPAHLDKSPSLSIRETDDGAVLLHCFSGCSVQSIMEIVGLNLSDLFPPIQRSGKEPKATPRLITATQALELLHQETVLIAIVGADLAKGDAIDEEDLNRCHRAVNRIAWIRTQFMENLK